MGVMQVPWLVIDQKVLLALYRAAQALGQVEVGEILVDRPRSDVRESLARLAEHGLAVCTKSQPQMWWTTADGSHVAMEMNARGGSA